MVRRIVARHTLIDGEGFAWEAQVTMPWVDRPDDTVTYGPDAGTGEAVPLVTLHTPNDPEHYAYGEDGPRFGLSSLAVLVKLAESAGQVNP